MRPNFSPGLAFAFSFALEFGAVAQAKFVKKTILFFYQNKTAFMLSTVNDKSSSTRHADSERDS